jgi:hypothetical protein
MANPKRVQALSRELVEREIAAVAQLILDIKAAVDPSTARGS